MAHKARRLTAQITSELIQTRRRQGEWTNRTIFDLATELCASDPDYVLVIDDGQKLTIAELCGQAHFLASALIARGLRPGDVISMLLPNWAETTIIYLAATMAGLVVNPILPILRDSEVGFMLKDSGSRLLFVPRSFRHFDYVEMLDKLLPNLPALENIVVLRGDPGTHTAWDDFIADHGAAADLPKTDPDDVKILMYTSGTTGRPKGVMHTHNTLQAEILTYINYWKLNADDVIFMASPVSHITGCLMAFELPWAIKAPVVLQDKWDATQAVALFLEHGVTFTSSSTPFLRELLEAAKARDEHLPLFTRFICGGMTIPPQLIRDAHLWFETAVVARCFGLSEVPSITLGTATRSEIDLGADTDGVISPGTEVQILDPNTGAVLPPGEHGEIAIKAPEQFVGYAKVEDTQKAFNENGFFLTGDLGVVTPDHCLIITGRKKDLIIRGGENLSAKEIEDALLAHPAIADIAVVAMPHERLGEGVACFIVPRPGMSISQAEISKFLVAAGLARQKIPERVELVDTLPRNFQGKLLKQVLRDRMRALCAG